MKPNDMKNEERIIPEDDYLWIEGCQKPAYQGCVNRFTVAIFTLAILSGVALTIASIVKH